MISKRIKAICKYCSKYNQEEFIRFDEIKPESYVDNFILEVFIKFLPLITCIILTLVGIFLIDDINNLKEYIGFSIIILTLSMIIPFTRIYKNHNYINTNIKDLLNEVKVSGITPIPCIVKGKIIGKGSPGYIFSEDIVIKDETGIMLLDYNQPLSIINLIFAIKNKKYFNQDVVVKGWYRRSPVPYIEIYTITIGNKVKKCYSYGFTIGLLILLLCTGVYIFVLGIM